MDKSIPNVADKCHVPQENILGVLKTPKLTGGSRIKYSFDQEEIKYFVECSKDFLR